MPVPWFLAWNWRISINQQKNLDNAQEILILVSSLFAPQFKFAWRVLLQHDPLLISHQRWKDNSSWTVCYQNLFFHPASEICQYLQANQIEVGHRLTWLTANKKKCANCTVLHCTAYCSGQFLQLFSLLRPTNQATKQSAGLSWRHNRYSCSILFLHQGSRIYYVGLISNQT